jgi:hypothetical protein
MHRAHRYITALFLTAALAAPVSIMAAPGPQISIQFRAYDRQHKDYHNWDNNEEQTYRGYLSEQHQNYRAYPKQSHKRQNQYWTYRHSRSE